MAYPTEPAARSTWRREHVHGYHAGLRGDALQSCPHPTGSNERRAWREGWAHSHKLRSHDFVALVNKED